VEAGSRSRDSRSGSLQRMVRRIYGHLGRVTTLVLAEDARMNFCGASAGVDTLVRRGLERDFATLVPVVVHVWRSVELSAVVIVGTVVRESTIADSIPPSSDRLRIAGFADARNSEASSAMPIRLTG